QTKYGEIYHCVNFYQQPAFDHPLLKDHKYEYKINFFMQMRHSYDQQKDNLETDHFDIWLNGKGCPANTVPIKKITKEELIKINIATELVHNNSINENPGVQVAVLRTSEKKKYYGGAMSHTVYRPTVQSMQYSSSRMVIRNGIDSIAAGWTVNPSLYPDNEPHFFIYTNTKDSHCYNTYCPGFIITSSKLPLDQLLKPYTTIGGDVYLSDVYVGQKDATSGDWFLRWKYDNITMGYWPREIFTNLVDSADYIEWGGEVYSPPGTIPPPMGSGYLYNPPKVWDNCYAEGVSLINENYKLDIDPPSCIPYHTSEKYNIIDVGFAPNNYDRVIFYGGH
ncbi:hypothetical protein LINGRAHAP2_LOCUS22699, partial [Linum grandiflorum]